MIEFLWVSYYLIKVNQKKSSTRVPECLIKKHALKLFKKDKKVIKTTCYAFFPQFKHSINTQQPRQQEQPTQHNKIIMSYSRFFGAFTGATGATGVTGATAFKECFLLQILFYFLKINFIIISNT